MVTRLHCVTFMTVMSNVSRITLRAAYSALEKAKWRRTPTEPEDLSRKTFLAHF